jgi:ATP-dependent Clp protease adaptor protein ClpS
MTTPAVIERPGVGTGLATQLEDMYQVVLWNDDHNTMEHVIECLMRVFAHPLQLAQKIMLEAHERGRAVAEVEAESPAKLHRDQLQSMGLTATLEKI